jgi:indolepyruvate ferredoxin oxidoreductase
MAGLAQKGGAVTTHLRLAPRPADIRAIRVSAGGADLILGCDLVVTAQARSLAAIAPGRTQVFVNMHETYPGEFTRDAELRLPTAELLGKVTGRAGDERTYAIEASGIAAALLGDAIAANMFLLGLAWQAGAVPLSRAAIDRAIELNGVEVAMNRAAFLWGRRAAAAPAEVLALAERGRGRTDRARTLDEIVARRVDFLIGYQDRDYAERYAGTVARVREAERQTVSGRQALAEAVAVQLFRLMAVKDEYEVGRLFTGGSFARQLRNQFASWEKLEFHLAPPLFARRDPESGHLRKKSYGRGMMRVFRLLAAAKGLRGTRFDIFGYSRERKMERQLLADYEATIDRILGRLSADNYERATALALWPQQIRGFGHVKEASIQRARGEAVARGGSFLAESAEVAEAAE